MKQFIFISLSILLAMGSVAQKSQLKSSEIKEVTVYLQTAVITRTAQVQLQPGVNWFSLNNLSPQIIAESIQMNLPNGVEIGTIQVKKDYAGEPAIPSEIKDLKEALNDTEIQLELRKKVKESYIHEKELYLANKQLLGGDSKLILEDLMEMAEIYRTKLREIEAKIIEVTQEEKKLAEKVKRLKNVLGEMGGTFSSPKRIIEVSLSSQRTQNVAITFSYQVRQAGWKPVYDIVCSGTDKPLKLMYKAEVFQRTEVNWKNAQVTLSTGSPTVNNTIPQLYPKYIDFFPDYKTQNKRMKSARMEAPMAMQVVDDEAGFGRASIQEGLVNINFKLAGKQDIPANGKPYTVGISNHTLQASYEYLSFPAKNEFSFLSAAFTGWENLKLLPGKSRIFYGSSLIGSAYIDPNQTNEEMVVSLGMDKEVKVEKETIQLTGKEAKVFGDNKKLFAYRITVKNAKNRTIDIKIKDQIPVSKNQDIQVEVLEQSQAKVNNENGFLEWERNLQSGQTAEIILKYVVKFPKGKKLRGL